MYRKYVSIAVISILLVGSLIGFAVQLAFAPVSSDPLNKPVNPNPPNSGTDPPASVTLPARVKDPDGNAMKQSFDEKAAAASTPPGFTIVALPDTQYYSQDYPAIFDNQTQWVVDNVENMNIVFVSQEGDIVNNYTDLSQWNNANHSLSMLDDHVPWGVLPGYNDGVYAGNLTNYNNYFGYNRFSGESWYGGGRPPDTNTNSYQLFSVGEDQFLIFHFQYNPSNSVLNWAATTIINNPGRRVIVVTHDYLDVDGAKTAIGARIWQRLVQPHADQIFLVLCAAQHAEASRTDIVNGHPVYQLLANYQTRSSGGNGWLRTYQFDPVEDKIFVKTYSPYLNSFETDSDSQFTLDYNMTSPLHTLTVDVTPTGSGTVSRNNTGPYHYGDWVRLTAAANSGWSFSQWSSDASGTSSQVDIFIDGDKSVTANFTRIKYTLIVNVSGQGSTNGTGTFMHDAFTNVTVLATPASGWLFDHWTLNGSNAGSENPYIVNMSANFDLTAVFTQMQYGYLVVRGQDGRIYYRFYNDSSGSWQDWNVVPYGETLDSPAAALYSDKLYFVVRDMGGYALWFSSVNLTDHSFSGWTLIDGATESAPTLARYGSNLVLVVRSLGDTIYYRLYDCVLGAWGDWAALPSGLTIDTPAASVLGNMLNVVVRGTDGYNIWHSYVNLSNNEFSGWQLVRGLTGSRPVLAESVSGNELYLVVRGLGDGIYYNVWDGAVWAGWTALPYGLTCDGPSSVVMDNKLCVVVREWQGPGMWYAYVDLNTSGFSGWSWVDGSTDSAPTLTR